jgi:hypothetical protein
MASVASERVRLVGRNVTVTVQLAPRATGVAALQVPLLV